MPCRLLTPFYGKNKGKEVQSILYNDLIEAAHQDELMADKLYFSAYSSAFISKFGNWLDQPEAVKDKIDENGEPKAQYVLEGTELDKANNPEKYGNKIKPGVDEVFNQNPELAKQRIKSDIEAGIDRANVPDSTIDRHAKLYEQALKDIKQEPITDYDSSVSGGKERNSPIMLQKATENMIQVADKFRDDIIEYKTYLQKKESIERRDEEGRPVSDKLREEVNNSKFNKSYVMYMGRPTKILQEMGVPDLDITVTADYIRTKLAGEQRHLLRVSDFKELVRALHNPIAVLDNIEEGVKHTDRIELITDLKNKDGLPIQVIFQLNKDVNKGKLQVHSIKTAFAVDHNNYRIAKVLENNKPYFINKERILPYLQGMDSQLAVLRYAKDSKKILISQERGFRNPKEKNDYTKVQKIVDKINSFTNTVSVDEVRFQREIADGAIVEAPEPELDIDVSLTDDGKKRAVVNILNDLKERFGLNYDLVDNPSADYRGAYNPKTGKIEINMAKVGWDTPFHEYSHPFVIAMEALNPKLYNAFIKALMSDVEGIKTYNSIVRTYPELNEDQAKAEALVTFIGKLATKNLDSQGNIKPQASPLYRTILQKFQDWVHNILNSILGRYNPIPDSKVKLNGSLQDLADFITYGTYENLSNFKTMSDLSIKYQKSDRFTFENVIDKVRDRVKVLRRIYKSRANRTSLEDELDTLEKLIDDKNDVAAVSHLTHGTIEYMNQVIARWDTLTKILDSKAPMSREDIAKNLTLLNEIRQLITLFQSTDDLYDIMSEEVKDQVGLDKIQEFLDTRRKMRQITGNMRSYMLDFLTEWLYPYAEQTNNALEAKGRDEKVLTKEQLRAQLSSAPKDIDTFQYWLGAAISSSDAVTALVAKAIKDSVYTAADKSQTTAHKLVEEYNKIRKRPLTDPGGKDEAKFNEKYLRYADSYERVGKDEDGNPVWGYVKRRAFHEEFLWDQFYKDKREFFKKLGPEPDPIEDPAGNRIWRHKRSIWYRNNEVVRPDIKEYITHKKSTLSEKKFKQWEFNNTRQVLFETYDNGQTNYDFMRSLGITYSKPDKGGYFRVYTVGELILPANKYRNKEYSSMVKDPYYSKLYEAYKEANEKYGRRRLRFGIIPQNDKRGKLLRDMQANGLKGSAKVLKDYMIDSVSADVQGTRVKNEFGEDEIVSNTIQRLDGTEVDDIPTPYTKLIDDTDLSLDLLQSVLLFTQAANNYEAMSDVEPQVQALKTLLLGDRELGVDPREVAKTEGGINKFINAITKKQVNKTQNKLVTQRLLTFIDATVYGNTRSRTVFKTPVGDIDMNKVSDVIGRLTSIQIMGLNLIAGVSNVALGNISTFGESVGGRYYSIKDWTAAKADYWKYLPEYLGKLKSGNKNESFLGQLQEHYDAIQGEFIDHFGHRVSGARLNRNSVRDSLFVFQHGGEHEIQMSGLLAMMRGQKVKTKSGGTISLLDAYQMDNGKLQLRPDVEWTSSQDASFKDRLHAINKELHGNYNTFDQGTAQRFWLGRLALMFRKFIYTGLRARYGAERIDYEMGDIRYGYYRQFAKTLVTDFRKYGFWGTVKLGTQAVTGKADPDKMTSDQAYAFKKTVYEMGILVATGILMTVVAGAGDDDDKFLRNIELQARRLNSDMGQFTSVYDFMRIASTPAVSMSAFARVLNAGRHLFTISRYERATGSAQKGDLKFPYDIKKLMPIWNQFEKLVTPENQIRFYEGSGAFL